MNLVKQAAQVKFDEAQAKFEETAGDNFTDQDLTLPGEPLKLGSRHPLVLVEKQIADIFSKLGFSL